MIYYNHRKEKTKMDALKRMTCKDYTSWDLNCSQHVTIRNRQKLEAIFKRKARRKMKMELKKEIY